MKSPPRTIILVLTIGAFLCWFGALYALSSGHPAIGDFLTYAPIIAFGGTYWLIWWGGTNNRILDASSETGQALATMVAQNGLPDVRVALGESGKVAEYPYPFTTPSCVVVPQRVLSHYSETALTWSLKTELTRVSLARRWWWAYSFVTLLAVLITECLPKVNLVDTLVRSMCLTGVLVVVISLAIDLTCRLLAPKMHQVGP